jgi:hypothetical protein
LSPALFNLISESLTKLILNAQENDLLIGLAPDLIENGIVVLRYVDDTVICLQHDPHKAINLKLLLYTFEMMSGLKINYLKSEFVTIGGDNDVMAFYVNMFNCQVGNLPMKYIGVPVTFQI